MAACGCEGSDGRHNFGWQWPLDRQVVLVKIGCFEIVVQRILKRECRTGGADQPWRAHSHGPGERMRKWRAGAERDGEPLRRIAVEHIQKLVPQDLVRIHAKAAANGGVA